ncbi:tyrosyl-DNA phosphodiesterase-domain-containing protein [Phaeosphaeriaceae sp. PMI808]|nr:tyrosyl-DNA phosphodiesterase-domain-containing protein [Phaeosphaeriaceae sp. PMI808]
MAYSSDDEDLKSAIALSLQSSLQTNEAASDDEEGEDMRRAIALSLQDAEGPDDSIKPILEHSAGSKTQVAPATLSNRVTGISGIDRKAMEQERLARLGKRKREQEPERSSKQVAKMAPSDFPKSLDTMSPSSAGTTLQYPKGVIKRTFATKFPRTDDITLEEVLEADHVQIAVISSFMWDSEWLNKKLNPAKVKQIWIMNAKYQDVQQRWVRDMADAGIPNLRLHFPPMDGMIHSMHSKFMLLFSKDKLRFVIPTANMTPVDWGEVKNDWQPGVMENSVFLIDLPRRHDGMVGSKEELTAFGTELIYFLEKQRVEKMVVEGVLKFDFSQTGHLGFVHSIGGSHKGELQHRTGFPGLMKAIRDLQLHDVKDMELDYAASSIGAINKVFLQRMYLAACGEEFTSAPVLPSINDSIRIYFPTDEAVKNSIGGPDCGGIITLTRQSYNAANFPRHCFRNYDSTRRGMLSHNKLLFGRGCKQDGSGVAWIYVGSANVSESAWGGQKVVKSGQMGNLNIRNWECGVVMAVPREKMAEAKGVPTMSVFEGTIEVPFVYPGQNYGDKLPWLFRAT